MAELDHSTPTQELDSLESELQQYLVRPPFWLRFSSLLEHRFESRSSAVRLKRFTKAGWLSLFFFDLLAVCDYFCLPEHYQGAWGIRLLLVTPAVLLLLLLLRWDRLIAWQGAILSCVQLVAAAGLSAMIVYLPILHYEQYLLQWVLLVLTGNLVFRLRLRVAVFTSCLLFALFAWTIFQIETSLMFTLNTIVLMGMVLVTSLVVKHRMELDGRITFVLKTLQKIAQIRLERANRKLQQQAARDGLTGIYNRRALDDNYQRLWLQAVRRKRPISVLFIDVDYFKKYNDTYGHPAGDDCLCWLADILQNAARRPLDLAARFGGEEFCLALPDTLPEDAGVIAEQIRARVLSAQKEHSASPHGYVTISIGVAGGIPDAGDATAHFIDQADQALYLAKAQGRNCVRYAS